MEKQRRSKQVAVGIFGGAAFMAFLGTPAAPALAEQGLSGNVTDSAALPEAYVGVAPGSGHKNPLPKPELNPPKLVWTGFQPSEAGGRVFLQTTVPVAFDVRDGGHFVALTLRNCRVHLRNNQRDLNTRFFDTPVAGIKTRQHKRDVEIVISLKAAMSATPQVEDGPDGTKFLVVDFPNLPRTPTNEVLREGQSPP
jgi:hypothetical protein